MFRGPYVKPLVEYSAICLTTGTTTELKAVKVGAYRNDHELRKQIDSRTPPAVLRSYMVLGVIATASADDTLKKLSRTRKIPIAKSE